MSSVFNPGAAQMAINVPCTAASRTLVLTNLFLRDENATEIENQGLRSNILFTTSSLSQLLGFRCDSAENTQFRRQLQLGKIMDLESVKRFLEAEGGDYEFTVDSMPERFIEPIVLQGIKIDHIERGRVLCSFTVPPRLLNTGNSLHGGATAALVDIVGSAVIFTMGAPTTGVSVEINVSYVGGASVGEEIEIESKALRVGKALAVVSVDFRSKKTGKLIAQGRHTKYLAVHSKL